MESFIRDDGRAIRVVRGFRERVLSYRPAVTPRAHWQADDFSSAAATRLRRARGRIAELELDGRPLDGRQILEVGCGAGIEALVTAMSPVEGLTGIDLELPLFAATPKGERTRRLAREVLRQAGREGDLDDVLGRLPIRFAVMDVTALGFADDSFDVVVTRSAMEHPSRSRPRWRRWRGVAKQGALVHHAIDAHYWVHGCPKRGVVDIPWAHARVSASRSGASCSRRARWRSSPGRRTGRRSPSRSWPNTEMRSRITWRASSARTWSVRASRCGCGRDSAAVSGVPRVLATGRAGTPQG
jgi:SAM-dependent methyltransferase